MILLFSIIIQVRGKRERRFFIFVFESQLKVRIIRRVKIIRQGNNFNLSIGMNVT